MRLRNDGDLDLLLENSYEPIRLFINHAGEANRWAKFDVVGEGSSRFAIGANIDVWTGRAWQMREVIARSDYKGQNELVQHFGLGSAAVMDEVVVLWPGGATRTLHDLLANQTWTLYPTDKLGRRRSFRSGRAARRLGSVLVTARSHICPASTARGAPAEIGHTAGSGTKGRCRPHRTVNRS